MVKCALAASCLFFAALSAHPAKELQSRYRRVESYEIRPGILATPTYGDTGQLCKLSVEKRHVQADVVEMSPTMPSKLTHEIIDELAPDSERGRRTRASGPFDYETISGSVAVLLLDYENVSVQIYRDRSGSGDTAVILKWKKSACGSYSEPNPKRSGNANPRSQQ